MTRAKDISKIITDADFSGTLDVTGTVTAGGLTVSGTAAINNIIDMTGSTANYIKAATSGGDLRFITNESGTNKQRVIISNNGDISFYEDTGTTPKLFWDASAEALGIGTSSPDKLMHLKTSVNNTAVLRIESTALDSYPFLSLKNDAREYQLTAHGPLGDVFTIYDGTAGSHRFVINSSGNVGIGTSSPDYNLQVEDTSSNISLALTSSTSGFSRVIFGDSGSATIGAVTYRNSDNSMAFEANGAERMRIPTSDSRSVLSIGSTAVYTGIISTAATNSSLISMNSGGGSEIVLSHHDALSTSGLGNVTFNRGSAQLASIGSACDGATDRGNLKFWTTPSGGSLTERMRIDSSGNVHIGGTAENTSSSFSFMTSGGDSYLNFNMNGRTSPITNTNGCYIWSGEGATGDYLAGTLVLQSRSNQSRDIAFITGTSPTERMRISGGGNIGINEISPAAKLHIRTNDNSTQLMLESSDADSGIGPHQVFYRNSASPADNDLLCELDFRGRNDNSQDVDYATINIKAQDVTDGTEDGIMILQTMVAGSIVSRIDINAGETVINQDQIDLDFRIESDISANAFLVKGDDNNVFMGKNNGSSSVEGARFNQGVNNHITMNGAQVILFNRGTNDGSIIGLAQADSTEGNISVSGNTVSYNAFSASHWSRLTDNSKPTILKGTVIETIDEMMDWYQLTFTVPATDDTPEHSPKISIALEDGQSVGDTITYNHDGTDYQATIIQEGDNKHTKCKISDTADSTRVYGVFADWDNDDDSVNDMYVTAVGTHVVRIHSSATVSAGDLLVSNGDGTAKVQDDDIIRSKTIGKVLTNIVQETYDDGSYTVPCALYCG